MRCNFNNTKRSADAVKMNGQEILSILTVD